MFDEYGSEERMRLQAEMREGLHSPCEDDRESTAPFIGICPDECEHEEVSPLDFSSNNRAICEDDRMFLLALSIGF